MITNNEGLLVFDNAPSAVAWADQVLTRRHPVGTLAAFFSKTGMDREVIEETALTVSTCLAGITPKISGTMYRYTYGHTDIEQEKFILYEIMGGIGQKYPNFAAEKLCVLAIATIRAIRRQKRRGENRINIRKLCNSIHMKRQWFYKRGYSWVHNDLRERAEQWIDSAERDLTIKLSDINLFD